jgi:wyosine [tRNA(Phe)-imidazoG37] synthetase (radical SAM superfamily)
VITFGPVPSRRLGRSLGVNNVPPKVCSYSCVYCQLGRTTRMSAERQEFYRPEEIVRAAREKVERAQQKGEPVDYLSFVPDGEPTLDTNLGREIDLLGSLGIRVAVISNSSLIWREDVRDELGKADWVSLKVDATDEDTWRRVDRPHGSLSLDSILQGVEEFASSFDGQLVTETMLVRGVNENPKQLVEVAAFVSQLDPAVAYLSVPTRPPAEHWVRVPTDEGLNQAYQIMSEKVDRVELLIAYEGDEFASTGGVEEDLLSITSVHPMRRDAVEAFLSKTEQDWSVVERLLDEESLAETEYSGVTFYVRRFR